MKKSVPLSPQASRFLAKLNDQITMRAQQLHDELRNVNQHWQDALLLVLGPEGFQESDGQTLSINFQAGAAEWGADEIPELKVLEGE